jgi:superfamily II DNA or RNA helicase
MTITVKFIDEVNCYIEGLSELQTEYIIEKTKLPVKGAFMTAGVRLGLDDGKESLFREDGIGFQFMLPDIFEALEEIGVDVDRIAIEDQREECNLPSPDMMIDENFLIEEMGYPLRDYQVDALKMVVTENKGIINAATNAGKASIAVGVAKIVDSYMKSLILVPSKYLVDQISKDFEQAGLNYCRLGDYKPNKRAKAIEDHNHIVCTYKLLLTSCELFDGHVMALVPDECYHPSHMILSRYTGWKYIKDVNIGEEVLAYDAVTMTSRFEPVLNTIEKDFSGDLCHLYARNRVDLLVTPNHEQPVWDENSNEYSRIKMKDFREGMEIPVSYDDKASKMTDTRPSHVEYDGKVYCVSVPSGNLVTKRDCSDVISISGNCHTFGPQTASVFRTELRNCPIRIGLTGTIPSDKLKAATIKCHLNGDRLLRVRPKELIDRGYASSTNIKVVKTEHHEVEQLSNEKEWEWMNEENYILNNQARLTAIAEYIQSLPLKNTMILCHAQAGTFLADFFGGKMIRDETPNETRNKYLAGFDESDEYYLPCSFQTTGTGVSINNIQRTVLVDVGKNEIAVLQGIGRGMRLDGKDNQIEVVDISANTKYSKRHRKERLKIYKREEFPFIEQEELIPIRSSDELFE